MVNRVLDDYEGSAPTPPSNYQRASKRLSLPSFGMPQKTSIVIAGADECHHKSNSFGAGVESVEDFRQVSAYLSTFVDDDSDDEEENHRAVPSPSEPKEIRTDGRTSRMSIKEQDKLVDFPMQPRRLSCDTGQGSIGHEEHEIFEKPANWIDHDHTDSDDEYSVNLTRSLGGADRRQKAQSCFI